MKQIILYLLLSIASTFLVGQAELSIMQSPYSSISDSAGYGDNCAINVTIQNTGMVSFYDFLYIVFENQALDVSNPNYRDTLLLFPDSIYLDPFDSLLFIIEKPITPESFRSGNDVIVIWPYAPMFPNGNDFTQNIFIAEDCQKFLFAHEESVTSSSRDLLVDYAFNDNLNDGSGNDFHASSSSVVYTDGIEGKAVVFDGTRSVSIPNEVKMKPFNSMSVSFWIKTTQTDEVTIISQQIGDNNRDEHNFSINLNSQYEGILETHFPAYNTNFPTTSIHTDPLSINDGEWHLLVVTKDAVKGKMNVYLDQCLMMSQHYKDELFSINGELVLGASYDGSNYFNGLLDELKIYDRALTKEDISSIWNEIKVPNLLMEENSNTNGECALCVVYPQVNSTYYLLDSQEEIIDSIVVHCDSIACFEKVVEDAVYSVKISKPYNDCERWFVENIVVDDCSLLSADINFDPYLDVYFNSEKKSLMIKASESRDVNLWLFDLNGRLIYSNRLLVTEGWNNLQLSDVVKGIYFLKLNSDNYSIAQPVLIH